MIDVMRRLLMLVACLAMAACGDAAVTPGADSSTPAETTPTPTATRTGATTLTEADSGTTLTLGVGESVRVSLSSDYHQPDEHGSGVRRSSASGGYPSGQPAIATFLAVERGSAELSSTTDHACLYATPSCALPQQQWTVRVNVF